ncbi:hypothetical protein F4604DRAFT_1800977 [Suillus subluteus]|nr:hypothetical protein F4604DRAFT_1800977 [Suillus subluteus]
MNLAGLVGYDELKSNRFVGLGRGGPVLGSGGPIVGKGCPVVLVGNGGPVMSIGGPVMAVGGPVVSIGRPIVAIGGPIVGSSRPVVGNGEPVLGGPGRPVIGNGRSIFGSELGFSKPDSLGIINETNSSFSVPGNDPSSDITACYEFPVSRYRQSRYNTGMPYQMFQ